MREKYLQAPIRVLFILLVLGLAYTQVLRFPYYSRLSKDNAIRIIPIEGPRGTIFDKNGVPLVNDRVSFNVAVVYQELRNREKLIRLLTNLLDVPRKKVEDAVDKSARKPYAPVTIVEDIEKDKAFILEEESFDIRGLVIETKSVRNYGYGSVGSHIFGYLSEISERELESLKEYGYRMKDLVGRDGLEKYYDKDLAGVDGGIQIQVDNRGRQVGVLGYKEPRKGKDLYLTIDLNLQKVCDKALEDKSGAIMVMDPGTGEVLALSSSPSYDPNIFIKPEGSSERLKLLKDKMRRPLLNRAISGAYPPGSIFKIVVASAALQIKRINTRTHFNCTGTYILGRGRFDCWKELGHGPQDVVNAIMNSCNVFFYNIGRAVGVDNIENFAHIFGFGKKTGIDLPDEVKGVAPGRLWKKLHKKDVWYEGDTVNYAIGQGYVLVTPVQILDMTAIIANKGSIVKPYIVKRIDTRDLMPAERKPAGLNSGVIKTVREGMYKVVNAEFGTGKRAKIEGVAIAGKTGTAQNPQGRTHAWFTGFAPFDPSTSLRVNGERSRTIDNSRICVVVFLEHGGKGGMEPSEIAKDIFEEAKNRGYL
ncbi:MAG: penicillin-binding protein 2 [Candidatus Omnitrophota bacterium]|nr:penicillin-binding protein 2 [Candidatus Omnitrophota bacterium]